MSVCFSVEGMSVDIEKMGSLEFTLKGQDGAEISVYTLALLLIYIDDDGDDDR